MIEILPRRMVPAFRQFCGDSHDITDACVAKVRRTGDEVAEAQFCGGFHHHCNVSGLWMLKRRHSIAFLLRLLLALFLLAEAMACHFLRNLSVCFL